MYNIKQALINWRPLALFSFDDVRLILIVAIEKDLRLVFTTAS